MKMSVCKSYGDLPLFLNAKLVAQVLGSRMVVPKEKFIQWAEEQSGGAK